MIKRCRFCGEKISADAAQCQHCGKRLREVAQDKPEEGARLTNLESWKQKTIPSWVMYVVLGVTAVCVVLMVIEGCNRMSGEGIPTTQSSPTP